MERFYAALLKLEQKGCIASEWGQAMQILAWFLAPRKEPS
jgi:hypothetical protein